MAKRPFIRKQKKKRHGTNFWDREYQKSDHLKLSEAPSEDFLKFLRFAERHYPELLQSPQHVLDLGCGNGRQLAHLQRQYNLSVSGYDTSAQAIALARTLCPNPDTYTLRVRSIAEPLLLEDNSCAVVLDMMTSHFLNASARARLREEIIRVLQPNGFLLIKTFLKDDDLHTERLLQEYPAKEPDTYVHPVLGVPEYVYSEEALLSYLGDDFTIERIYRSHKHRFRGQARKRRTITIYARKNIS